MKVFLLCAGKGTRLGDLTKNIPKCALKIGSKTMLEYWWQLFRYYNITEVLINTHYLYNKIIEACVPLIPQGINITFTYEQELLGTGKTIFINRDFVKNEKYFLIIYADTWLRINLKMFTHYHKRHKGLGTIGIYTPDTLCDQGILEIDKRKILTVEEKPKMPKSSYAYAGIMLGTNAIFKFYNSNIIDLVRDWFPIIKDGLNPYFINDTVIDIGTPERYASACKVIPKMGLKTL